MNTPFNPDSEPQLVAITLLDLIQRGNVLVHNYTKSSCEKYSGDFLSDNGGNLTFYVDKKMNAMHPLQLKLLDRTTLIPNIPVGALKLRQDDFLEHLWQLYPSRIVLPLQETSEYAMVANFENRNSSSLFGKANCGWVKKESPLLEARTDYLFEAGHVKAAISIARYEL